MEIIENRKPLNRKHFLVRALDAGNITKAQYDAEMPGLEKQLEDNLKVYLVKFKEELKDEAKKVKKVVTSDGDLKRATAKILITFLRESFTPEEIKGIMRQGYKIMRAET